MRILIVSYWYLPVRNPRTYRWSSIAERWAAEGHRVEVLCQWSPGLAREEEVGGVAIHRAGGALVARLRSRFGKPSSWPGEERRADIRPGKRGLLSRLNDLVWRRLWWPDFACLWYRPAIREAGRLVRVGRWDGLVSVSAPFTSHMVGRWINRRRPGIRWVADMGDPFSTQTMTPVNNPSLYRALNRRIEEEIIARASAVTVTGEGFLDDLRSAFPGSAGKTAVVPPLLAAEPEEGGGERVFPRDDKLRLVSVGTLYRGVREPDHLLALFDLLLRAGPGERLELHFFGNTRECAGSFEPYRRLMGVKVFLHGTVSRERVLRAMSEAACLVNIGNATANQLPSKVVEYAAAGKPIVNLVSTPRDSAAAFLRGHPALLNLPRAEGPALKEEAGELARFIANPPEVDREALRSWMARFRVEAAAPLYERLLRGDKAFQGPAIPDTIGRSD